MLTKESILQNVDLMKATIEAFDSLDVNDTIDYLGKIVALQSTATETMASAKYHLLQSIDDELTRQAKLVGNDKVAPSIKKMRADAKCREWHYIYELCERYASNISHTIGAVRTKISYIKQEMANT